MSNPIYEFRQSLGLNQKDFAKAISSQGTHSIGQSTVSNYEQGIRTPYRPILLQIIKLANKHSYLLTIDKIYRYFEKLARAS